LKHQQHKEIKMGRKVSIGVVGSGGGLGTIVASGTGNTLTTAVTNQNLIIDPNGTGITQIIGATQLNAQSELRLADSDSSNYVSFRSAATVASNVTWTLPNADGTNGYVLSTNGSGTLSWLSLSSAGVAITDAGSTATVHYPIFATNSGSIITTGQTTAMNNRANLAFVPSTGELTATALNAANHYGSNSNSGTITIRGTTSATKATASVLMTDAVASSTTTTGTLVVTGGVGVSGQITTTTLVETSSIAFKENVNPIDNALAAIMQLVGVTYDRKDNNEHEAGLIAEEVNKILPDLVSKDANGDPHGIKYTKLTAYLIEAIKSLKQEINELKR
jgi:hypothetical protein